MGFSPAAQKYHPQLGKPGSRVHSHIGLKSSVGALVDLAINRRTWDGLAVGQGILVGPILDGVVILVWRLGKDILGPGVPIIGHASIALDS